MKFFVKISKVAFLVFLFMCVCCVFACAKGESYEKLLDNKGGILSVSHRGDSAEYPKNSLEAVLSAADKGADMISVSVRMSKDGVLFLCEDGYLSGVCDTNVNYANELSEKELSKLKLYFGDEVSKYHLQTLEKTLKKLNSRAILILDNSWEYKDEILKFCRENNMTQSVILRTNENAKEIASWVSRTSSEIKVIGTCKSAIVWTVQGHLSILSKASQPIVQYQSKNYFCVMYDNFTAKKYSADQNARALAPMYEKDLCGQRNDNAVGWDEMVERGFSVIETNCIEELESYIKDTNETHQKLFDLTERAKSISLDRYSSGSCDNFKYALNKAEEILENKNASLGQLQQCFSALLQSINNLTFGEHNDTQRGNLNVTAGKVIATVVFGSLLLAGEIYVYKMRKSKKETEA